MSHTYESYRFHRMSTPVLLVNRSLRDAEEDGKLPLSAQVSRQKVPKFLAVVEEVQRRILSDSATYMLALFSNFVLASETLN